VWKCFSGNATGDVGDGDRVRGWSEVAVNTSALNEGCEVEWEQDLKGFVRVKEIYLK